MQISKLAVPASLLRLFASILISLPIIASALPQTIVDHQNLMVREGSCEAKWANLSDDLDSKHYPLGDGLELWVVPCAHWAINMDWSAFIQIPEASQPGGFLYTPVHFVDYSPYKGIYATDVIKNVQIDRAAKTLTGNQTFQTGGLCGSASLFTYSSSQQTFVLTKMAKSDDCKAPGPWKVIYPFEK